MPEYQPIAHIDSDDPMVRVDPTVELVPELIHRRDLRHRVNAGLDLAVCIASRPEPLDLDGATGVPLTGNPAEVTCHRCKTAYVNAYPWTAAAERHT